MQLKFLYALSLLLCLSAFASPNECIRRCHSAAVTTGAATSVAALPSTSAATARPRANTAAINRPTNASRVNTTAAAAATDTDQSCSLTLIKLFYI